MTPSSGKVSSWLRLGTSPTARRKPEVFALSEKTSGMVGQDELAVVRALLVTRPKESFGRMVERLA